MAKENDGNQTNSDIENEISREINEIHTENVISTAANNGDIENRAVTQQLQQQEQQQQNLAESESVNNCLGGIEKDRYGINCYSNLFVDLSLIDFTLILESTEPPKREENPFSLKHFLKRDLSTSSSTSVCNTVTTTSTSSTNYQNNQTGARPKIPQSQSQQHQHQNQNQSDLVNNKMKRSPRFPSFDSQSSLNDYQITNDSLNMKNLFHSRSSNTSFNDYNNQDIIDLTETQINPNNNSKTHITTSSTTPSLSTYVQSVFTNNNNYDHRLNGGRQHCHSGGGGGGTSNEFSSALPDFVQDHLVVEQLYNTSQLSSSQLSLDVEQSPPGFCSDLNSR